MTFWKNRKVAAVIVQWKPYHTHTNSCVWVTTVVKRLQSAGPIREETEKAIYFEAFAQCEEQRGWQDAPGAVQCRPLGCLSSLKELDWPVITKTFSLIFPPGSGKLVPQLSSQPANWRAQTWPGLATSTQIFFSVLPAWEAYINVWTYSLQTD